MTDAEALSYAIDWLRAFPVVPTSRPGVLEERLAVVARLDEMRKTIDRGADQVDADPGSCAACKGRGGLTGPGWSTGCGHCYGIGRAEAAKGE